MRLGQYATCSVQGSDFRKFRAARALLQLGNPDPLVGRVRLRDVARPKTTPESHHWPAPPRRKNNETRRTLLAETTEKLFHQRQPRASVSSAGHGFLSFTFETLAGSFRDFRNAPSPGVCAPPIHPATSGDPH